MNAETIERTATGEKKLSVNVMLHFLWIVPFAYFLFVMPLLRDSGVRLGVSEKLTSDITNKFGAELKSAEIGYIRSGSGSLFHGGSVSAYGEYKGLIPSKPIGSWDYAAPADTPHVHIIANAARYEVRMDADDSKPYSNVLSDVSKVIEFALSNTQSQRATSRTWQ